MSCKLQLTFPMFTHCFAFMQMWMMLVNWKRNNRKSETLVALASNGGFILPVPLPDSPRQFLLHALNSSACLFAFVYINVLATFSINTYFISVCSVSLYISLIWRPQSRRNSLAAFVLLFLFFFCWFASVLLYIYYIRIWCFDVLPLSLSLSLVI